MRGESDFFSPAWTSPEESLRRLHFRIALREIARRDVACTIPSIGGTELLMSSTEISTSRVQSLQ